MSKSRPNEAAGLDVFGAGMTRAHHYWWLFALLGILLIIGGTVAIAYPFLSTVAAVLVLGAVLLVCGVFVIIGAFWAGKWSAMLLQLLVGILYVMAGLAIRDAPLESVEILTMFAAAFFIVVGAFRIVASLVERFPQWGWALLNGLVTLLAGIIIYDSFPNSAIWVIGLLVGLELLFNGWTWLMLSFVLRRVTDDDEAAEESA